MAAIRGCLALAALGLSLQGGLCAQERVMESILPALTYGPSCWSRIQLQNLGDRVVAVDVEGHRESGALVPLAGRDAMAFSLGPGERASCQLQIEEETASAWVRVRERIPERGLTPVVALSGLSECVSGEQLRTTTRGVVYPMRDPWFAGEVNANRGEVVSLINASERAARASICYSSGNLYSVPIEGHGAPDMKPICSTAFEVQIPPFGTRLFPVEHEGSSYFSLKTAGEAVVLQMLRPVEARLKLYSVDSTIRFDSEPITAPSSRR